ncbi:SRPBCC family protein [Geopsychrobacter electrodiphilus]|uniref:SRPBCC family protein n=1 Tax=Geopsychrobacter electrodiphilus TaxID=225196 RepID=UPI00036F34F2|nr:SRPBCC family protein [Geopsychrobacter electrodiphilus]
MKSSLLLFLLFFALLTPAAFAATVTPDELQTLQGGTILVKEVPEEVKGYQTFLAHAVIAAPLAKIYKVLIDFSAYPDFMPNVEKVVVRGADQQVARLDYYLGLPMGVKKRYRLKMTYQIAADKAEIGWQLIPWPELSAAETIRDTSGYWRLTPLPGDKTLVEYRVRTDPGDIPFGTGWIVDLQTKGSLPDILESTRKRAIK